MNKKLILNFKDTNDFEWDEVGHTFRVLTAGYYRVSTAITRAVPTGKFEMVKNPDRNLFNFFWTPKYIEQEIFEIEKIWGGQEVVYLTPDDKVDSRVIKDAYKIK